MAEAPEASEESAPEPLTEGSPAAVALALGRTSKANKAIDGKAAAFLDEQTGLVRLQKEHLHEQRTVQLSHLKLRRFNEWMKAALQVMTVCVGLLVLGVVSAMAWQAHDDHGVVVAPFSVPPELAQRGLTGQVVAARVLDRLAELQARTISARPASTYAENWGDDIKVEIPETGVSFGELYRYLRLWLGAETRISGEVVRTPAGLQVTARAGAQPGKTVEGPEADVDTLIGKAAEGLYATTQPYRYAAFLPSSGRSQEGLAAFTRLSQSGPAEERAWAYFALASAQFNSDQLQGAVENGRKAEELDPRLIGGCSIIAASLYWSAGLSHDEAALQQWRRCLELVRSGRVVGLTEDQAREVITGQRLAVEGQGNITTRPFSVQALAADHDVGASRRLLSEPGGFDDNAAPLSLAYGKAWQDLELEDWAGMIAELEPAQARFAPAVGSRPAVERMMQPLLAYAYARAGRQADADVLVARLPFDCDTCTIARGKVAAAKRDWPAAERWFALVSGRAPSIPFAPYEWGAELLAKGDVDGAIARLSQAHQASPHFADPLELWGEALLRKGDASGAAAKFAEADRYAPRWGRNHLRWGQALAKQGKVEAAQAQWRAASGMDLSAADGASLQGLLKAA